MKSQIDYIYGMGAIRDGNYKKASELFQEAVKLNNPDGFEGLGLMFELGIGYDRNLSTANEFYETGAKYGSNKCRQAIQRINTNGHYSASYKSTYIENLKRQAQQYQNSPIIGGGYVGGGSTNNNSRSSGSTYSSGKNTCPTCHGSGLCSYCKGRGWNEITTAYGTSVKNCIQCYGNKTCRGCGGRGYFY